jgi:hypothetical protein
MLNPPPPMPPPKGLLGIMGPPGCAGAACWGP